MTCGIGQGSPQVIPDSPGDGLIISAFEQQIRSQCSQHLRNRPYRCPEDWSPAGQSFGCHEAKPLKFSGGQHEGICRLVVEGQSGLRNKPQKADVFSETKGGRERFQILTERATSADQQVRFGRVLTQARHGPNQSVQAHARLEIAEREKQKRSGWETEGFAHSVAIRCRLESLGIHTSRNLYDSLGGNSVELSELARGEVAQHVNAAGTPEADALDNPQERYA